MYDVNLSPFIKWVGGKSRLINYISEFYPNNTSNITRYVEPFIGGGAILFNICQNYNFDEIYISDYNKDLIDTYITIRDNVEELLSLLKLYQFEYISLPQECKRMYYINMRYKFNKMRKQDCNISQKSAIFIFINKTCFNGLYRVNSLGDFNTPMGSYNMPTVYDKNNILSVSKFLKRVNINRCEYLDTIKYINKNTFVYLDPPYRPISISSSFTSYTENKFNDTNQIELKRYIDEINNIEAKFVMSNSDPKNINPDDNFFDELYSGYKITRVPISRTIGCKNRNIINELIISNIK